LQRAVNKLKEIISFSYGLIFLIYTLNTRN